MKNPLTVSELIHKLSAMSGDANVVTWHGSLAITDVKTVGYNDAVYLVNDTYLPTKPDAENLNKAEFIHRCEEIQAEFEEGIAKYEKRKEWLKWGERLSSLGGFMLLMSLIYGLFGGK